MQGPARLSRRKLLLALGALTVGGVGGARVLRSDEPALDLATAPDPVPSVPARAEPTAAPEPTPEPTAEPTPEPTEEPESAIEPPEPAAPYELVDREVYGEAKLLAAAVAQAVATYAPDEDPGEVVARSLVRPAEGVDLGASIEAAGQLIDPALASRGRAIDPQLGGLAPHDGMLRCSVMVVTEQLLRDAEGERVVIRTIDVRLIGDGATWWLEGIASTGGTETPRPADLPEIAVAVLDDPRIELPDSARWDIHEGIVDHRLLETMLVIAERAPYAVTSLRNGHPVRVFGTDRPSNHTHGRAVDIWRVGDHPVVSQQPEEGTVAWDANRWLFDAGHVEELGGPWSFDGRGGRSFTNDVHLDHLHVAFHDPARPDPQVPPEEAAPAPEEGTG
jgi:hypothetical protein